MLMFSIQKNACFPLKRFTPVISLGLDFLLFNLQIFSRSLLSVEDLILKPICDWCFLVPLWFSIFRN